MGTGGPRMSSPVRIDSSIVRDDGERADNRVVDNCLHPRSFVMNDDSAALLAIPFEGLASEALPCLYPLGVVEPLIGPTPPIIVLNRFNPPLGLLVWIDLGCDI